MNSNGPRTDPCVTLCLTLREQDAQSSISTRAVPDSLFSNPAGAGAEAGFMKKSGRIS